MADLEDLSPGPSDDGLSFEDAADGSPLALRSRELDEDTKIAAHMQEDEVGSTSEQSGINSSFSSGNVTDTTSTSASSKGGAKSKGAGVSALLAKFQNGSTTVAAGTGPGSGNSRSGSINSPRRLAKPSSIDARSGKVEVKSADEDELKQTTPEETSVSESATSFTESSGFIQNPFRGNMTPVTAALESFHQTDVVQVDNPDQAKAEVEYDAIPDTPTTSQANRFSVVSLSTPTPKDTSIDSIVSGLEDVAIESPTSSSTQAEFLARQTARLNKAEGEKRSSALGAEKIKERARELRYGHSRESSGNFRAGEAGPSSTAAINIVADVVQDNVDKEEGAWDVVMNEGDAIDWDFWGNVMSNYQEIAQTQPRQLSQAIQAGIPGALRGMMWQLMSSSKDEEMELIYAFYLKQTSPHEKMIRKDLARTFPGQEYFRDGKGIGQENLFNVVKAYSLYDEECGYCQGMQFVVGPLLLNMPDEEAFSTLVRLMKSYDLRGHFIPNMPALQLRLFQFDRLLEETLPLLHRHLVRLGVKSSMYASGWFMTLFSYRSPLDICFRILDSVFAEGIEALFRFAMALMKKNEEDLLKLSFEEAVPLLAARIFDIYKSDVGQEGHAATESQDEKSGGAIVSGGYRVNEFIRDAFEFRITAFLLDSYASDFAEQVKEATSHKREMQELKQQNRTLQAKVKDLEDQLGAVQEEHVDLVKSVVMAKLAKEEMAEELVKYKLMYAESTLMADISGVNRGSLQSQLSPSSSTQSNRS